MGMPSSHRCKIHYVESTSFVGGCTKTTSLIGPDRCHNSMSIVDVMVIGVK